ICAGAEQKLVGVWDPPRKAEVERAFVATGRPGAPEVWKSLEQILDRYNAEWVAAHTEACAATRLRGEQSEVLLDLRMACLQQRLAAERELTTLFARADGALLGKSVQAASALEPVAGCADTRALTAGDHRPSDAAARERLDSIDASLAKIKALSLAGKYQEDLPIAEATVAAAKRESYAPLLAAAQYELGVLQFQLGDPKASEATLAEASTAGIAGGRDDLTARALAFRGWVLGAQLNQAEGLRSLDLARGAILHLGGSDELEGFRLTLDASARNALGQPEPAIVGLRAALLLREKVYGNDSFQVAEVLRDLGHALSAAGKQAEAIEVLGRSLVLCERLFGPAHPQVAGALIHRGSALVGLGQSAEALPDLERSLSIREGWYGPDSPLVVEAVMQLGGALTDLKRWREAEPLFQRALAVSEQIHDPYPDAVIALGALSEIHLELGQPALAVADAERAAAHPLGSQLAPEARAENDFELAKALWIVGADRPRARKLAESAQKTFETSPPGELVATREEIASWLASHEIGAAKMR
ncbi:MAG: tetratricopeptide repeat protein, partial [Proteobacteria bacterium]|nr:tetratricopeptide repeat protein [Pseudomonadota bacterium]